MQNSRYEEVLASKHGARYNPYFYFLEHYPQQLPESLDTNRLNFERRANREQVCYLSLTQELPLLLDDYRADRFHLTVDQSFQPSRCIFSATHATFHVTHKHNALWQAKIHLYFDSYARLLKKDFFQVDVAGTRQATLEINQAMHLALDAMAAQLRDVVLLPWFGRIRQQRDLHFQRVQTFCASLDKLFPITSETKLAEYERLYAALLEDLQPMNALHPMHESVIAQHYEKTLAQGQTMLKKRQQAKAQPVQVDEDVLQMSSAGKQQVSFEVATSVQEAREAFSHFRAVFLVSSQKADPFCQYQEREGLQLFVLQQVFADYQQGVGRQEVDDLFAALNNLAEPHQQLLLCLKKGDVVQADKWLPYTSDQMTIRELDDVLYALKSVTDRCLQETLTFINQHFLVYKLLLANCLFFPCDDYTLVSNLLLKVSHDHRVFAIFRDQGAHLSGKICIHGELFIGLLTTLFSFGMNQDVHGLRAYGINAALPLVRKKTYPPFLLGENGQSVVLTEKRQSCSSSFGPFRDECRLLRGRSVLVYVARERHMDFLRALLEEYPLTDFSFEEVLLSYMLASLEQFFALKRGSVCFELHLSEENAAAYGRTMLPFLQRKMWDIMREPEQAQLRKCLCFLQAFISREGKCVDDEITTAALRGLLFVQASLFVKQSPAFDTALSFKVLYERVKVSLENKGGVNFQQEFVDSTLDFYESHKDKLQDPDSLDRCQKLNRLSGTVCLSGKGHLKS